MKATDALCAALSIAMDTGGPNYDENACSLQRAYYINRLDTTAPYVLSPYVNNKPCRIHIKRHDLCMYVHVSLDSEHLCQTPAKD